MHPLDFTFLDLHGEAQLSSLVAHTMVLEIVNQSVDDVLLGDPEQPASSTTPAHACHFVVRFRTGTLRPDLANIGIGERPSDDWDIVGRQHLGDWDELFIKGPTTDRIESGHSRHLTLTQMQGAPSGTHNTRVLFLYHGLQSDASDGGPVPLEGQREKRLTIEAAWPAERCDAPRLPVEASFIGLSVVTSDVINSETGNGSESGC